MAKDKRKMVVEITTKDSTKKGTKSATSNFEKTAVAVGKVTIAAAAATLAIGTAYVSATLKAIDVQIKFADRIGASIKGLSGLQHAAALTGVETAALNMGLQRMTRRVAEAAQGTGEAVKALDELGISAETLNKLRPEEQFKVIAEAMGEVEAQSDKVRLAFKLFDSEGVALVNTLKLGAEGLRAAEEEAEKFGITISRIDAIKVEEANDSLHRMGQAAKGLWTQLSVSLTPAITGVSSAISAAISSGDMEKYGDLLSGLIMAPFNVRSAIGLMKSGVLSFTEFAKMNSAELAAFLVDFRAQDPFVRAAKEGIQELESQLDSLLEARRGALFKTTKSRLDLAISEARADLSEAQDMLSELVARGLGGIDTAITGAELPTGPDRLQLGGIGVDVSIDDPSQEALARIKDHNDAVLQLARDRESWMTKIMRSGATERGKFESLSFDQQLTEAAGFAANLTAQAAKSSRRAFEANKAFRLAEAATDLPAGVAKTFNSYHYPWNIPLAALHLTAGLGQIRDIAGSTYSGGSAASVPAASVPAAVTPPAIDDTVIQTTPTPQPTTPANIQAAPQYTIQVFNSGTIVDRSLDQFARDLVTPYEQARLDGVEPQVI